MARKANISNEEIHQACWTLLEKNVFPNIPRVANYFLEIDGRKCSNTTFLNAISEWEEEYKLKQQHEIAELTGLLAPSLERFNRDVTKVIGTLLDEKRSDLESAQQLKEQATHGSQLSLASALCDLQDQYDELLERHNATKLDLQEVKQDALNLQKHHADVLNHNRVLVRQLEEAQNHISTLNLAKGQYQVDLAKQDHHIQALTATLEDRENKIQSLTKMLNDKQLNDERVLNDKLEQIQRQLTQLNTKNSGNK